MRILNRNYQKTMLDIVDGVKVEGDKVHIYGRILRFNVFGEEKASLYHYLIHDAQTGNIISEHSWKKLERLAPIDWVLYSILGIVSAGAGLIPILRRVTPSGRLRIKNSEIYNRNVAVYMHNDLAYWRERAEKIPVYQGSIDEVAEELGVQLKRVDTNNPIKYIRAEDHFLLRVNAFLMGADAVVHSQPGSSIGTPVKIIKRKRAK